jgi:hypothetical protein
MDPEMENPLSTFSNVVLFGVTRSNIHWLMSDFISLASSLLQLLIKNEKATIAVKRNIDFSIEIKDTTKT